MANYKYTIRLNLLKEKHVVKKRCFCEYQLCHGWFIPTRVNQKTCLFDLAQKNILHLYPIINPTKYQILNKNNGKTFDVDVLIFAENCVEVVFNNKTIIFNEKDGGLVHNLYELKQKNDTRS